MEENNNLTNSKRSDDLNSISETPTNPTVPPISNPPKKLSSLALVLITLACIIITISTVTAFYFYTLAQKNSQENITSKITPTEIPLTTQTISGQETQFGILTWLSEPKKITPPNISIASESLNLQKDDSNFYQVGEFSDGSKLIDGYLVFDMPGTSLVRLIESSGQYYYLNNYLEDYLKTSFTTSSTTMKSLDLSLNDLTIPDSITSGSLTFKKTYTTTEQFSSLTNPKKLFDSEYGSVYQVDTAVPDLDGMYTKKFYLKLKDSNLVLYELADQPNQKDFSSRITLSNGSTPSSFNQNIVTSCAVGGVGVPYVKADSPLIADKKEVGKTSDGKSVYQIVNVNSKLINFLYNLYKVGRDYPGASPLVSLSEFANLQNHLFWQDSQGDWQIFLNTEYSTMAECGKPVIYLYPQTETQVKVQVGAQITKSEPTYPNQGWLVTAKPNGELTYQNQSYPYLFWEGLGNGIYPDYQDQGTLVSQKDLISTVYKQLSQLGLNQKESADFMEFWQPKLPKTPYVRLTWLNTQDMDRLAPLAVNPKPDTKIRIFLEFEGLEKPITLKPQKLSAPKRDGFTLVEWGGLLLTKPLE